MQYYNFRYLVALASFVVLTLILFSNSGKSFETQRLYVERHRDIATKQAARSGVPPSIILAQGCLESRNGKSRLAKKHNNHFGIKCHGYGKCTKKGNFPDDDPNDQFRIYDDEWLSYIDHSDFLQKHDRYNKCWDCKRDYKCWAKALKKAGYATSKTYAEKLISIIERQGLNEFDSEESYTFDYDAYDPKKNNLHTKHVSAPLSKGVAVKNYKKKKKKSRKKVIKPQPKKDEHSYEYDWDNDPENLEDESHIAARKKEEAERLAKERREVEEKRKRIEAEIKANELAEKEAADKADRLRRYKERKAREAAKKKKEEADKAKSQLTRQQIVSIKIKESQIKNLEADLATIQAAIDRHIDDGKPFDDKYWELNNDKKKKESDIEMQKNMIKMIKKQGDK